MNATSPLPRLRGAELARLFNPGSIAIIGASSDPAKFSGRFVPYLQRQGYSGTIYPINARRDEIGGVRCYPDLSAVPGTVDCVIYAAAPGEALKGLAACADKQVKLIVMTAAGFAERGDDEGRRMEQALVRLARSSGARLLGPNCVGFLNAIDHVAGAAAAAFEWQPPLPTGRIGVASQSGGLAMASIILGGWAEGIGYSHVLSTGNEADIDIVDAGTFLLEDEHTDVVCLTIEAVRDGAAFQKLLEEAQRAAKPVVILKTGKSDIGQRMAASHTGALAGSHAVFEAVAKRHGAALVDDLDDLWQVAQMFAKLRASGKLIAGTGRFAGDGCTSCSVSGGHIGLLADMAGHAGLSFPELAESTQEKLREALGKGGAILNPVDMSGGSVSDHGAWARCLAPLLEDPGVTTALPILTAAKNYDSVSQDLEQLAQTTDKLILVTWAGASFQGEGKALLQRSALPLFSTPGRTVRALLALHAWQRVHAHHALPARATAPSHHPGQAPHPVVLSAVESGRQTLGERESKELLAELGFSVTREALATHAEEAVAHARSIGYPVVLKGEHAAITHKTEAGLVRLDLRDDNAVRAAFADIEARMALAERNTKAAGVLVAEMAAPGIEFMMGVHRDALFGPMVMFGLGGIYIEALRDTCLAPAPLSLAEARALLTGIRGAALLTGVRGRQAADLDRLAELLCRLGDFAVTHAEQISSIDINPLVLHNRPGDNLCVLDALIVLDPT